MLLHPKDKAWASLKKLLQGLNVAFPLQIILYRPILDEKNGIYTIEAYDGEIKLRTEEMKKMSAQQVQNALVFFWNFGKIFVKTL